MNLRRPLACLGLALTSCGCGSSATSPGPFTFNTTPFGSVVGTQVPGFRNHRPIFVYLPPGYQRTARTYPILVVLDGETAFGGANTLNIQQVMDSLLAVGRISPTIVAAIASPNNFDLRFHEYIPEEGGNSFLAGVRDTVLPAMRAQFNASSDPDSTYLLGYSLGGIMAFQGVFAFNETFHRAAGLSVSYWASDRTWRSTMLANGHGHVDRFYQDTGSGDDNHFIYLQWVETVARDSLGFVPDCDLKTVLVPGGNHDMVSWSHRMPSILDYLLGPPGSACGGLAASQLPR